MNRKSSLLICFAFGCLSAAGACAQAGDSPTAPPANTPPFSSDSPTAARPGALAPPVKGKKGKSTYAGPNNIIVLPPTPMLDSEGRQRLDPDGKPMFNPPVQQLRDKKGHPVFDADNKPEFQTATNLGYDEKGRKIAVKKVKPPKMTPVSISAGTLTVDGWTGKAQLNYDIADLKYMYIYVPGIGIAIVSQNTFPGAKEEPGAFNDRSLKVAIEGHAIELSSEKRLLGKKPQPAWVAVDRNFVLPSKFPVFGYGSATRPPYAWPGAKQAVEAKGPVQAPPLPDDVRPKLLLAPCPTGMMRPAGSTLPGQKAGEQPCVPIKPSPSQGSTATPPAASSTVSAQAK